MRKLGEEMKFLVIGLLLLSSLSATAQRNVTGKSVNTSHFGSNISLPSHFGLVINQESPCKTQITEESDHFDINHNMRTNVIVRLQNINVAVGSSYVGVTSEGDIANVYNNGSGPLMALQICHRKGIKRTAGKLLSNPIINNSFSCQVDEITAATVDIPTETGSLLLQFKPIYFSGSSLCNGSYLLEEQSDSNRNDIKEIKETNESNSTSSNVNKQ